MFRVLLAVVLACLCSLVLADEQDAKINDIFKDFKKAEDAFADVVRGVDADALDDFDDRIKNAGKRGGVESVERWNQQKKQYIRTRAMNQDDKDARYTRMVLLAAGAVPKISKAFNALEDSHKAALKKASDANEVDVLVTLNAEWRKLLPFINPEVKDGLQALRYYCLEANEAAEPVMQNPAPMVPQGQANNRPMNGAGVAEEVNADGVSRKCLELFGELPSEVLYDRLRGSDEKRGALGDFIRAFYREYPPMNWTASDVHYIVNQLREVQYKCKALAFMDWKGSQKFGLYLYSRDNVETSDEQWKKEAAIHSGRHYVNWLFSSPDTDTFIERRSHLKSRQDTAFLEHYWEKVAYPISKIFYPTAAPSAVFDSLIQDSKEYFRMWLAQSGLDTPEEMKAFVMKLQSKNLSFPQANEILNQINSP